jgi:hypothetical protein
LEHGDDIAQSGGAWRVVKRVDLAQHGRLDAEDSSRAEVSGGAVHLAVLPVDFEVHVMVQRVRTMIKQSELFRKPSELVDTVVLIPL